jgi:dTDP-4-amino-4,6-dideoxygalactose transaminase
MHCLEDLIDQTRRRFSQNNSTVQSYVGEKNIDRALLDQALALSHEFGWYSNFGPVSQLLEAYIAKDLQLPDHRCVVATANGTCALMALLGLHDYLHHKKLRWVVSGYGFFSTAIGPLQEAKIVDCDENGMLDLAQLKQLDPSSYDGIILTNVVGVVGDIQAHKDFCQENNKLLLMDNAAAYYTPVRDGGIDEIVSFHHTKPAGFGEGGCVIVDKKHAPIIRSLINFSVNLDEVGRYNYIAQNGKISDLACAYILQQLIQLQENKMYYQAQYIRIKNISKNLGFEIMQEISQDNICRHLPGSVPVLSNKMTSNDDLLNKHFVMRKYYKPLTAGCDKAEGIYSKNINIPCHPGMKNVTDETVKKVLADHMNLGKE